MAKAVEQTKKGLTVAHTRLGLHTNGTRMSVKEAIHDGDTATVDPDGNVSVRLLGVDAPEVSFPLPNSAPKTFPQIKSAEWATFLTNPFAAGLPAFDPPLDTALVASLVSRIGATCAANHARHADAATRGLEGLIDKDCIDQGLTKETVKLFIAFATDVIDRYGRFLGYLDQDLTNPPPGHLTYNERLLTEGLVIPYFIWPNINPFRKQPNLLEAVPRPGHSITDPRLDKARQSIRDARASQVGIFEAGDPLKLLPFEVRYLARTFKRGNQKLRGGPDRWIINLAAADDLLLPPQEYIKIPNPEDRLFVPAEYVALFRDRGWKT